MRRRARHLRPERRPSVRERIGRFVRQLFGGGRGWSADDPRWDEPAGGVGVREPRRPRPPTRSGTVALEPPPSERRDTWAVGGSD